MKRILLLLVPFLTGGIAYSQLCDVSITTPTSQVCPGSTINLNATGFVTGSNYSFNFNFGTLPSGWTSSGGTNFGNSICGPNLDGSNYFWASTSSSTPEIATAGFDICSGGNLKFDMRYAVQGGSVPCEGPDEADEGVSIEYKVGAGPWVEFIYYRPDGVELSNCPSSNVVVASGPTIYTVWRTFTVPIPAAAISTNTKFRWVQKNSTGGDYDNWGLDNVFVNAGPCVSGNIDWSTGTLNNENSSVVANSDTCVIAYLYDVNNVLLCQSSPVCFTVFDPNINAGADQTICQGQSVTVAASGGTGFTWDNSVTNGTPFTPTATQMYHVTGTDPNGCLATDSLMVTVNALINTGISYPDNSFCNSDANPTPTINGSSAGVFTISPSTMTINATTGVPSLLSSTVSPSQSYTISYTPTDVCLAPSTVDITVYSVPTATISSAVSVCQNDTEPQLVFTGSNATANYIFEYNINGGTTQSATSNGNTYTLNIPTANSGTFTYNLTNVTESGPEACLSTLNQSVVFTVFDPNIEAGIDQTICIGQAVTLTASSGTSFTWDNSVTNGTPFNPTATQMYHVSGTDPNGCLATDSLTVTVNALITTGISYPDISFCNSDANPTPTISGSTAGVFTISPNTMNINASTGVLNLLSSTVSPSQIYTITYTPTDVCLAPTTANITVYSVPNATITSSVTVCQNDTEPQVVFTGSNATANYIFEYNINGGTNHTATSNGNTYTLNVPTASSGTFTYTLTSVTESSPKACFSSLNQAIVITVNPTPILTVTGDQSICYGDSVILTASGASSYVWSDAVTNGILFYPTTTKTYTVQGTSSNNCSATQTITVTVKPLPNIVAGIDQRACYGSAITLSGSAGVSYVWSGGIINNQAFIPTLGNHTYYVVGMGANGCRNIDSVNVYIIEPVVAGIAANPNSGFPGLQVNFTNNSLHANHFDWDFGNGFTASNVTTVGQTSTYLTPGVYNAIITASNGYCEDTAQVKITISAYPDPTIKVPNVFTPNGDQVNDVFWIDVENGKTIYVQIFNRWGNLMNEMKDFTETWNGKSQAGDDATDGVYFYKYVVVDLNDKTYEGHGHLTLER